MRFHSCLISLLVLCLTLSACSDVAEVTAVPGANATTRVGLDAPKVQTTLLVPQPTLTSTPLPTATPSPQTFLHLADTARVNRDDAQAIALYEQASALFAAGSMEQMQAQFRLGQVALDGNDLARAGELLRTLRDTQNAPPELRTQAAILLAQMQRNSGDGAGAIAQYTQLISASQLLAPYFNLWIGETYLATNQPISAVQPLQEAIALAPSASAEFARREKLALAYRNSQQYARAVAQYEAILGRSQVAAYRSRIQVEMAGDMINAGQTAQAIPVLQDVLANAVQRNPQAAASALVTLLNLGAPVDEVQRGIVNYAAGNYSAAQQAFRTAIQNNPDRANEIRYWAGQNYLALNDPLNAYRNFDQNIADGAGSPRYGDTLIRKAQSYSDEGDVDSAAATYRQLLQSAPTDAQAGKAAFNLGRTYERFQQVPQAEEAYRLAFGNYPSSETAPEALLRAGALQVRLGQFAQAMSSTQLMAQRYATNTLTPLAQLWEAKAQLAAGNVVSGQAILQNLAQTRPDQLAGVRAAELLAGQAPLTPMTRTIEAALTNTSDEGKAEAEQWLSSWVSPTTTTVAQDVRWQRGAALMQLGYEQEALDEYNGVLADRARDPAALYALAVQLRDLRLYRLSIAAAEALMRLSPTPTPVAMPKFIARLIYPTYYADLVKQYASEFGVDPFLLLSVMRQESLFEAGASSVVAAQGLMQVMAPTGQEIAQSLKWPLNYDATDLTRPYVSVRFGAYYVSRQKAFFENDMFAALAAYNGGAGNAIKWRERAGNDPDAFYLVVNFEETQRYLRAVATNYGMYRRVWGG